MYTWHMLFSGWFWPALPAKQTDRFWLHSPLSHRFKPSEWGVTAAHLLSQVNTAAQVSLLEVPFSHQLSFYLGDTPEETMS